MRTAVPFLAILLLLLVPARPGHGHPHLVKLDAMEGATFADLIADLQDERVVFVGETHDDPAHHQAQLAIIRALHQAGREVVVGLEMMRREDQELLDAWVARHLPPDQFEQIFHRNWGWWPLYRPIFEYARENSIPMLALNVSREITAQVAREGFDSLRPEQMRQLGNISCRLDPAYEQFIRRAMGGHAHGEASFQNFCEAQLVWDTAMAQRVRHYLDAHPQGKVVVLAGSGHAWKYGIPARLNIPADEYAVILPVVPGRTVSPEDADYLWLDPSPADWEH